MALEKILQSVQGAFAVPKDHVLDVGHECKLAVGNQLGKPPRGFDRRAAGPINVVAGARKNQCWHCYSRRIAECVPGTACLVMVAVLLGTGLPLPERVGNFLGRGVTTYGDGPTAAPTFGQFVGGVGTGPNAIPAFANIDPPRMFQVQVRFIF